MSSPKQATSAEQELPANTVKVEKGTLSAVVSLDGTLTYRAGADGSPYSVIDRAQGTYTKLPDIGQVISLRSGALPGGRQPSAIAVRLDARLSEPVGRADGRRRGRAQR
jgi:hypothetical protein